MKREMRAKISKTLFQIVIFGIFFSSGYAQDSGFNQAGFVGAQFLKIQPGARARGMGGAFSSVSNDPNAVFYNPAGITGIENHSFSVSHLSWIADINYESLVYTINLSGIGNLSLSVAYLGTGDMDVITTEQQDGTGEKFSYSDLAIGLSYARSLTDKFSLGLTVKFVNETIYKFHARGIAFDVGTQYKTGLGSLVISMAMTNFGQDLQFNGTYINTEVVAGTTTMLTEERNFASFALPLNFTLGISYDVVYSKNFKTKLTFDAIHPNDYSERVHMGAETTILNILALRFGYKFNYDVESWSAGLGVSPSFDKLDFNFDFSYSTFNTFGHVSSLSLTIGF
jgi:hypothetical protein